ncbi:MAG: hypothetical protein U9O89_07870, partial [Thermoproteota archaeon]|nr:hypothetical protein [Thermoproteota archaeon]
FFSRTLKVVSTLTLGLSSLIFNPFHLLSFTYRFFLMNFAIPPRFPSADLGDPTSTAVVMVGSLAFNVTSSALNPRKLVIIPEHTSSWDFSPHIYYFVHKLGKVGAVPLKTAVTPMEASLNSQKHQ